MISITLKQDEKKFFYIKKFSTSSQDACIIPLYVLNSVCVINCLRTDAVNWPHLYGTIGSQSPWHWSNGVFLFPIASYNTWCYKKILYTLF